MPLADFVFLQEIKDGNCNDEKNCDDAKDHTDHRSYPIMCESRSSIFKCKNVMRINNLNSNIIPYVIRNGAVVAGHRIQPNKSEFNTTVMHKIF